MKFNTFIFTGSSHVHMLIWLKDAPILPDKALSSRSEGIEIYEKIFIFVDSISTCSKTWDGSYHFGSTGKSNEETWKDLLKTRRTHKHTSSCRRKRGGKTVCRFNIPFFPMLGTSLLTPLNWDKYSEDQLKVFQKKLSKHNGSLK